jgi:hypothetical protein
MVAEGTKYWMPMNQYIGVSSTPSCTCSTRASGPR